MLSELEKKRIKEKTEKVDELVRKYLYDDDFSDEAAREIFVRRLRNTIIRSGCTSIKELCEHEGPIIGASSRCSFSYVVIERMKDSYKSDDFRKQRLKEIDKEIRKLSEERKAILKDLEA